MDALVSQPNEAKVPDDDDDNDDDDDDDAGEVPVSQPNEAKLPDRQFSSSRLSFSYAYKAFRSHGPFCFLISKAADDVYQFALCDTEDNLFSGPSHSHKCTGSS